MPQSKLLNLGSDGSNVNKTIWSNINEELKALGLSGLLPFVPCNMHVVHNSFRKGQGVWPIIRTASDRPILIFQEFPLQKRRLP